MIPCGLANFCFADDLVKSYLSFPVTIRGHALISRAAPSSKILMPNDSHVALSTPLRDLVYFFAIISLNNTFLNVITLTPCQSGCRNALSATTFPTLFRHAYSTFPDRSFYGSNHLRSKHCMAPPWVTFDSAASYNGDCANGAEPDIAGLGVRWPVVSQRIY
jgi:hypothetical protein